jgi:hypothetical protein
MPNKVYAEQNLNSPVSKGTTPTHPQTTCGPTKTRLITGCQSVEHDFTPVFCACQDLYATVQNQQIVAARVALVKYDAVRRQGNLLSLGKQFLRGRILKGGQLW